MGNECCSTKTVDSLNEIQGTTLRPCQSQMIGGKVYHTDQIWKIVRLQKRIRDFI